MFFFKKRSFKDVLFLKPYKKWRNDLLQQNVELIPNSVYRRTKRKNTVDKKVV